MAGYRDRDFIDTGEFDNSLGHSGRALWSASGGVP
jgi:hypothetical protein